MFDDRNGCVFVPRLVLFVLVGVDIPCRFFRVKLDRCFPPYKYLAKCRGARPIRPRAPSTFLYFNSGRHAPAYIKRIEGKKYSILPKISQKIFLSKIYKVFVRPTADISAVGHFSYTTSCTVSLNICPFAKHIERAFSASDRSQTKKSDKIGLISSKRFFASVLKLFSAFLNCSCSIVVYVLLLFFHFAARFALCTYIIPFQLP